MDLRLNTLIAWPKPRKEEEGAPPKASITLGAELDNFRLERVLYVDANNNELWAIDVNNNKAWPERYGLSELTDNIKSDRARIIVGYEPHHIISLTDEELGPDFAKYIEYRDAAWRLIEPLLQIEIKKLLTKRVRTAIIADIARKTGRAGNKVRFQLRRYWQRGCTINALFPDWYLRGLKGTELPGSKKRGRPTLEKDENGQPVGVNVTPEDEKIFEKGIAKYVVSGAASDLHAAWQSIKENFYTTGSYIPKQTEEGIIFAPELLPAHQIPTVEQFMRIRSRK